MYWRGVMAEAGEAGPADPAGAVPWYERAYQRGFGDAAFALGRLYGTGHGVPRDIDQAYRMYGAARARGSAGDAEAAIERLNFARRFGAPPSPDVEGALVAIAHQMRPLAATILRPLAVAGNADAQYWLATTGRELHRSPSDRDEMIRWYRAAALQEDAEAAYQLRDMA